MFRYHWTEHYLCICLLSYRIVYVLFKYHNYYCCGEYYTYDAVGGEEYAICYRVDSKYYRFLLLATMLHLILPNSNLQKYVKFVVSLLLVVLILTPLFKLLQTDVNEVIANFNEEKYVAEGSVKIQ